MKFYIGSGFYNIDNVRYVGKALETQGHHLTYDWTQNERASTLKDLQIIGRNEVEAIRASDFIIILLPAGKGSHVELGIALGLGTPIFLHSSDDSFDDFDKTSTFYHVSPVIKCQGELSTLIETIAASVKTYLDN